MLNTIRLAVDNASNDDKTLTFVQVLDDFEQVDFVIFSLLLLYMVETENLGTPVESVGFLLLQIVENRHRKLELDSL
jgi:hypothetical protein